MSEGGQHSVESLIALMPAHWNHQPQVHKPKLKMAKKKSTSARKKTARSVTKDDAQRPKLLVGNADRMAQSADEALFIAEDLGVKTKAVESLTLTPTHREVLFGIPKIAKSISAKLMKDSADFSVAEVAKMITAICKNLPETSLSQQIALLHLGKDLLNQLQKKISDEGKIALKAFKKPGAKTDSSLVYQFKITLVHSKPPIWRRIQIENCSLDQLHEHIQTAMGWTNSHLHQFEISKQQYGDPQLLEHMFEDFGYIDSTKTLISRILFEKAKRFKFKYEYDFGDGWGHDIVFEGSYEKQPGKRYPLCVDGALACPPEDIGGIYGYYEFLDALADPEHEEHDYFMEWADEFDPENFDATDATKAMKKGLPDWR